MFTSMRLQEFKSWSDTGEIRLAPVTGFFGANSSGKSSLLHSFVLMKQTAQSSDLADALNLGDNSSIIDFGNLAQIKHGGFYGRLSMSFEWKTQSWLAALTQATAERKLSPGEISDPYLDVRIQPDLGFQFTTTALGADVEELRYRTGTDILQYKASSESVHPKPRHYMLRILSGDQDPTEESSVYCVTDLEPPTKCYKYTSGAHQATRGSTILSTLEREFERRFIDELHYLGPLRQRAHRAYLWRQSAPVDVGIDGSNAVQALLAARDRGKTNTRAHRSVRTADQPITVEEHVSQWLQELGLASVFETRRLHHGNEFYEVLLRAAPSAQQISLSDVGFGISQVLPVLVMLAYVPKNATVLLEQPEMHLHPAAQAGLADILIEVAKARSLQILVESHSEHLLARLQRRVAEEAIDNDDVALYFCEHDGHKSEITSLELNEFGEIQNWPKNFFGDAMGEAVAMIEARARREE